MDGSYEEGFGIIEEKAFQNVELLKMERPGEHGLEELPIGT